MPRFAANLSMLYPELDFLDRFEAAARDGFEGGGVSCSRTPIRRPSWRRRLKANGLQQVLFNAPPGRLGARANGASPACRGASTSSATASSGRWPTRRRWRARAFT